MMATNQRASGGGMAKTCPKCGAALRDDGPSLPCDWCSDPAEPARYSADQPGDHPSDGRRLVTGLISCALGLLSLWVLSQVADAASCDPSTDWCFVGPEAVFVLIVLPLWVMASPFALATILPFGTFRRVVVGLGVALLSAAATLIAAIYLSDVGVPPSFVLSAAVIAFCLTLYPAYRLAR